MVKLYENGKSCVTIVRREYDLTPSGLDRWINSHPETESFAAKDHRTDAEIKLVKLTEP